MPPHFPQSAFYDIFTLVDDHYVCVYVSLKGARDQIQLHQHEFGFMRFAFLIQSLTSSLLGFNNNDWVVLLWASMPLPPPRWFQKGFCAYFRRNRQTPLSSSGETKDLKRVVPRCKLSSQNWWSLGLFGLTIKTSFIALLLLLLPTWGWIMLQAETVSRFFTPTLLF